MREKSTLLFTSQFEKDVYEGLTQFPKHLSSKYFYDSKGDALFQEIMEMPTYYLTNCEFDILETFKNEICNYFKSDFNGFDLIELGAGDGKKTKILLEHLVNLNTSFTYLPIDISENALEQLKTSLHNELPDVSVNPMQGTYFESIESLCRTHQRKKVILFLGSNIGNLLHPQAIEFLLGIQNLMNKEDLFLIGFDQKKHPQTILEAYSDREGITEKFNKNLLTRINRELDGDFNPDKFIHWEVYDPESGTAKSYLVSKEKQEVRINHLGMNISFGAWETIHTEISQKYNPETVRWLCKKAGLEIVDEFGDTKKMYKNYLLKKNSE